ncbi:MAG: phosphatase PAP2 family protein [Elusimicrobia bacterium]|nr:phosphatase PAP2 family protein [Elusimicrobiota bacterium]
MLAAIRRAAPREDLWLAAWLGLFALTAGVLVALNGAFFRYTGIAYFPRALLCVLPPLVELAAFGAWLEPRQPRAAFAVRHLSFYALETVALAWLLTGIQYTPFPPIDARLARWDAALGWSTTGVLAWTWSHPLLRRLMQWCYASLNVQLVALPAAAALGRDRRTMRVYLYAVAYSFLAGGLFYYFFPSSGPAAVFSSPFFTAEQRNTFVKFWQVHHGLPVASVMGGMIAFPSFHVAWAVLLTYAARPWRPLFRAAAALNVLVVASTLLLGWHYLLDVPAGLALAGASLWAAERTHARLSRRGAA